MYGIADKIAITITFCSKSMDEVVADVDRALDGVNSIVISEEFSMNSHRHFHLFVELKKRRNVNVDHLIHVLKSRGLDGIWVTKCNHGWYRYVIKDKNWKCYGNITPEQVSQIVVNRNSMKPTERAMEMLRTHTLEEVRDAFPSVVLQRYHVFQKMKADFDREEANIQQVAERRTLPEFNLALLKGNDLKLAKYLIFTSPSRDPSARLDKRHHLYIWGKRGTGKSRLVQMLKKFYRIFEYHANQSNWQDDYNGHYDYIIWDEHTDDIKTSGMTLPQQNAFLDSVGKINRRGMSAVVRTEQTPVIYLGNVNPAELYPDCDDEQRKAWLSRLFEINTFEGEITLFKEYWDKKVLTLENFYNDDEATTLLSMPHVEPFEVAAPVTLLQPVRNEEDFNIPATEQEFDDSAVVFNLEKSEENIQNFQEEMEENSFHLDHDFDFEL